VEMGKEHEWDLLTLCLENLKLTTVPMRPRPERGSQVSLLHIPNTDLCMLNNQQSGNIVDMLWDHTFCRTGPRILLKVTSLLTPCRCIMDKDASKGRTSAKTFDSNMVLRVVHRLMIA
jgi:hypothetical protein